MSQDDRQYAASGATLSWTVALGAALSVGLALLSGSGRGPADGPPPSRMRRGWRPALIVGSAAVLLGSLQIEEEIALPLLGLCYGATWLPVRLRRHER